jgi:hypothetical protein
MSRRLRPSQLSLNESGRPARPVYEDLTMTEQTLITITPDELIERAHAAAAEADAEKARELEARQADQLRETEAKQRERADQLRTLIRETCGFDMAIQPDDLENGYEWRIHPEVTLNAENWIGGGMRTTQHLMAYHRYSRRRFPITTLADLSRVIAQAEAKAAERAAEREARRLKQEEADRLQAERDARRTDLEQQRAALVDQEPHAPDPQFYVSAAECSDGLLLVPAGPILDVYPLRFTSAHPLYLLSLHQHTVERLLKTLEDTGTPDIITAGLQTIAVMDDESSDAGVSITWIKESDDGASHTGWVVHQCWAATDFTDGLSTWLAFRQAVRDWEARLRVIDDKLHALYATDF